MMRLALAISLLLAGAHAQASDAKFTVRTTALGGKRIDVDPGKQVRSWRHLGTTEWRSTVEVERPIEFGDPRLAPVTDARVEKPGLLRRFPLSVTTRGKSGGGIRLTQTGARKVLMRGQLLEKASSGSEYGRPFEKTFEGKDAVEQAVADANRRIAESE
jgi:hypothetical protein